MRARKILLSGLLVLVVLASTVGIAIYGAVGTFDVAIPESLRGDEPGDLVAAERIGKYPAFASRYFLDSVELPEPIDVTYGVSLYRVQYRTTNHDGTIVVASGLVGLPGKSPADGVVMYLHGTTAQRNAAPSQGGLGDGTLMAAAAAGSGLILVAPDYIGLGESHEMHPYMHAETTTSTCIDFLGAAKTLVKHLRGRWPGSLYLVGFSQGGHATFAVQRELESMDDPPFEVQASAPVAGPFHLRDVSFPQAMTGTADSHVFYLAYLANAYAQIYGQPLDSILVAPYVKRVPVLFDGDHDSDTIAAGLPDEPRELFTSEFLEAYDQGRDHWFLDALVENSVAGWTPVAPVRIYYGDNDLDVLPEEARRAEAAMRAQGADVTAISVGPFDHNQSALHALPTAIRWFAQGSPSTRTAETAP